MRYKLPDGTLTPDLAFPAGTPPDQILSFIQQNYGQGQGQGALDAGDGRRTSLIDGTPLPPNDPLLDTNVSAGPAPQLTGGLRVLGLAGQALMRGGLIAGGMPGNLESLGVGAKNWATGEDEDPSNTVFPTTQHLEDIIRRGPAPWLIHSDNLTPGAGEYPTLETWGTGALEGATSGLLAGGMGKTGDVVLRVPPGGPGPVLMAASGVGADAGGRVGQLLFPGSQAASAIGGLLGGLGVGGMGHSLDRTLQRSAATQAEREAADAAASAAAEAGRVRLVNTDLSLDRDEQYQQALRDNAAAHEQAIADALDAHANATANADLAIKQAHTALGGPHTYETAGGIAQTAAQDFIANQGPALREQALEPIGASIPDDAPVPSTNLQARVREINTAAGRAQPVVDVLTSHIPRALEPALDTALQPDEVPPLEPDGGPPAPSPAPTSEGSTPSAPAPTPASLVGQAFRRAGGLADGFASIKDVKDQLRDSGMSDAEINKALQDLHMSGQVSLQSLADQRSVTPAQQAAGFPFKGQHVNVMALLDRDLAKSPPPRPVPTQAPAPPPDTSAPPDEPEPVPTHFTWREQRAVGKAIGAIAGNPRLNGGQPDEVSRSLYQAHMQDMRDYLAGMPDINGVPAPDAYDQAMAEAERIHHVEQGTMGALATANRPMPNDPLPGKAVQALLEEGQTDGTRLANLREFTPQAADAMGSALLNNNRDAWLQLTPLAQRSLAGDQARADTLTNMLTQEQRAAENAKLMAGPDSPSLALKRTADEAALERARQGTQADRRAQSAANWQQFQAQQALQAARARLAPLTPPARGDGFRSYFAGEVADRLRQLSPLATGGTAWMMVPPEMNSVNHGLAWLGGALVPTAARGLRAGLAQPTIPIIASGLGGGQAEGEGGTPSP